MALTYPNKIFRGDVVVDQPRTVTGVVAGAYNPGTFVTKSGTALNQATTGKARVFLLDCRDFYTQTANDAYEADETAHAYRIKPEVEYRARAEAAAYADGAELAINASGVLKAAVAGDVVTAFADGAVTIAAEGFIDIVTANTYVKA